MCDKNRCSWCLMNEKMIKYHDEEWGVPLFDDKKQFEFLMLEVMQCGLSWNLMIRKREIFKSCFLDFDFNVVSEFDEADIERIMSVDGMIKSRRKIEAVIHNARCFKKIIGEFGSFSKYLWKFTGDRICLYSGHENGMIPSKNALSEFISKDLKKRGFKYMGAITVYSHLQACGIINDHVKSCFRYNEVMKNHLTVQKYSYDQM